MQVIFIFVNKKKNVYGKNRISNCFDFFEIILEELIKYKNYVFINLFIIVN
jgi:hypothetical protein